MADNRQAFHIMTHAFGPHEIVDRGSRFIAYLNPISNASTAADFIAGLRKARHDATHVCSAYRLRLERGEECGYSDDGEPSGTAGLPIYNELKRADLFNVAVAVVRYYGGVKLGTGGLTRAYGRVVRELLDRAPLQERLVTRSFRLQIPFDLTCAVLTLLKRQDVEISSREYTAMGQDLEIQVPVDSLSTLSRALEDRSAGKIRLTEPGVEVP